MGWWGEDQKALFKKKTHVYNFLIGGGERKEKAGFFWGVAFFFCILKKTLLMTVYILQKVHGTRVWFFLFFLFCWKVPQNLAYKTGVFFSNEQIS